MFDQSSKDYRISLYVEATERMKRGDYRIQLPVTPNDDVGRLGKSLQDLAFTLDSLYRGLQKLEKITARINEGLLLDDILENVYQDFREIIPYNRIGFSLIDQDGKTVRAYWAKSDLPGVQLSAGYTSPLAGSSLETIIATGQPRILNDLPNYLAHKPGSDSTRLIVAEGIRSSLTCPLIANGAPVGFIFFSSVRANTYADVHVDTFKRIAAQLSVVLEKGHLVSQLVAQNDAIARQNDELRRLNELKDSFLGMAAHDLRNPIGYVQMTTALLLDPEVRWSEAQRQDIFEDLNRQTHHMVALLDDLLDVTQIEAGKLTLQCEPIEMSSFLDEAAKRHAMLAAPKGTQVLLETVPPGNVMADRSRLRQVIDNLISNAIKYSPAGSTVRVSAQQVQSGWRVNVQDQGPGITPEDRKRLFQDFAKLSARPTGGEKSVGLGLAITRRVVEAHGGQIGVDSEPGHGSTFWFTLPGQAGQSAILHE